MNYLVTGATGFVRRALCDELRRRGEGVVPLGRRATRDGELIACDLGSAPPDPGLLREADAVIHLAAIAHRRAAPDEYRRINLDASVRLARAAAASGVRRFLFMSSVKAMGPPAGSRPRAESDLRAPLGHYALSKRQAEQALQREFADADMSVTVLRPALVYGAGVRGNLAALAAGVRRGLPLPPAQGGRSMISRADLVELVIDLASDPPPSVSTWIAVDGEAYSTRRICDAMRAALGRPPGREWLPPAAWHAACALADRLRPAEEPYRQLLFGTELYSAEALRRLRGWSPRRRLEDEIGAIMGLQAA